jgi:hypothetical protein
LILLLDDDDDDGGGGEDNPVGPVSALDVDRPPSPLW